MQKVVTKFYFDKAKYRVGDSIGNEVWMEIDYKNRWFRIRKLIARKGIEKFKEKVAVVASRLIEKKHNVNFSDRI